ncbi:MAG: DUF3108 domain-containing protein [Bacteroidales bacterium]|nr:DUF3108 domain-containing protein [Bacteroidales bacterium]
MLLFVFSDFLYAQCNILHDVFQDGEKVTYTVSYNWGPVWVNAGEVTFSAGQELYKGKDTYHLKASGKTFTSYDLLFKVRDYYDTWVDPVNMQSIDFRRYIYEGGYTLLNTLNFNYSNHSIISNTKTDNNPQRTDTVRLMPCSYDMLAAIYYTRSIDLSSLKPEEKRNVKVYIDDGYYDIAIRAIGKEMVENTDGKKYHCIKFAVKMVQGTIFRGDEDVIVWVTDDANKIPIYIEAKIIVGVIKAYLKDATGVRNPMKALVREKG